MASVRILRGIANIYIYIYIIGKRLVVFIIPPPLPSVLFITVWKANATADKDYFGKTRRNVPRVIRNNDPEDAPLVIAAPYGRNAAMGMC